MREPLPILRNVIGYSYTCLGNGGGSGDIWGNWSREYRNNPLLWMR